MRNTAAVALALSLFAGTTFAAPREGRLPDPPLYQRVIRFVKHLLPMPLDGGQISVPHP
jgi:hypothetical protein